MVQIESCQLGQLHGPNDGPAQFVHPPRQLVEGVRVLGHQALAFHGHEQVVRGGFAESDSAGQVAQRCGAREVSNDFS